jgi:hypothetical protein
MYYKLDENVEFIRSFLWLRGFSLCVFVWICLNTLNKLFLLLQAKCVDCPWDEKQFSMKIKHNR